MPLDESVKTLQPTERIKRLMELEDQKKKEIEEAERLLKEARKEAGDQEEEQRQLPVPQMKAASHENLETIEAKVVWASKRGISIPASTSASPEAESTAARALEETVQTEQIQAASTTTSAGVQYAGRMQAEKQKTEMYSGQQAEDEYFGMKKQQEMYHNHGEESHAEYGSRSTLPGHEREAQAFYTSERKKKTTY